MELRKNTLPYMSSILNAGRYVFDNAKVDSIVTVFCKTDIEKLQVLKMDNKLIKSLRSFDKKKIKPPYALDFLFSNKLELVTKIEEVAITRI